jgi:hypothetical protein
MGGTSLKIVVVLFGSCHDEEAQGTHFTRGFNGPEPVDLGDTTDSKQETWVSMTSRLTVNETRDAMALLCLPIIASISRMRAISPPVYAGQYIVQLLNWPRHVCRCLHLIP